MGMDVYGSDPNNERGEYFRNNIWYWPELWTMVTNVAKDVLSETQIVEGFTNSGMGVTSEQSLEIADKLFALLENKDRDNTMLEAAANPKGTELRDQMGSVFGMIKNTIADQLKDLEIVYDEPDCDWENVENFANFCKHSGGFEIW